MTGEPLPWVRVLEEGTHPNGTRYRVTRDSTRGLRRTVELEVEPGRFEPVGNIVRVDGRALATPRNHVDGRPGAHVISAPTYAAAALELVAAYTLVPVVTYRVMSRDVPTASHAREGI